MHGGVNVAPSNVTGDNTSTMSEELLELAIGYVVSTQYPPGLDKAKKRAIRRRAATLTIENGEVFVERRGRKVKVITTVADQNRILRSCHSDPTSGHFGEACRTKSVTW